MCTYQSTSLQWHLAQYPLSHLFQLIVSLCNPRILQGVSTGYPSQRMKSALVRMWDVLDLAQAPRVDCERNRTPPSTFWRFAEMQLLETTRGYTALIIEVRRRIYEMGESAYAEKRGRPTRICLRQTPQPSRPHDSYLRFSDHVARKFHCHKPAY